MVSLGSLRRRHRGGGPVRPRGAVRHFLRAWPGGARWWDGRYDLTPAARGGAPRPRGGLSRAAGGQGGGERRNQQVSLGVKMVSKWVKIGKNP